MARERRADDRMRAGHIVCQTVAGHHVDAPAVLLEIRQAISLEVNLDEGVLTQLGAGNRMRNSMLTGLDLTNLQPGDSRVFDSSLKRRRIERINIELPAEICQRISPALDLLTWR